MYQSVPLSYPPNCVQLFAAVRALPGALWLDSAHPASSSGRYDIITAAPSAIIEAKTAGQAILEQDGKCDEHNGCPLALADALLQSMPPLPRDLRRLPFAGGLAGYFGYEYGKQLENTPVSKPSVASLPLLRLGLYHWSLVVDHQSHTAQLIFLDSVAPQTKEQVLKIVAECGQEAAGSNFTLDSGFAPSMSTEDYRASIQRIHDYIRAGDCYQVNFAQHFSAPFSGDSFQAYLALRTALPSPFCAYMDWQTSTGDHQAILSLSPERFLEVNEAGTVEAKPIKGTIRRGCDRDSDQENANWLLNSDKDRSENLMIVDLLRNDLGKSCRAGSIAVPKLFALESYANVHHLVSTVTGQLETDCSSLELLKGCFPGGSITGAPKRRAMEIIEELEQTQRSIYCGSIGYISRCGRMDTNIAIRTLVADNGKLHCWGGGGIVIDSDPDAEYQESLDKVQVLMNTLENL